MTINNVLVEPVTHYTHTQKEQQVFNITIHMAQLATATHKIFPFIRLLFILKITLRSKCYLWYMV